MPAAKPTKTVVKAVKPVAKKKAPATDKKPAKKAVGKTAARKTAPAKTRAKIVKPIDPEESLVRLCAEAALDKTLMELNDQNRWLLALLDAADKYKYRGGDAYLTEFVRKLREEIQSTG